MKFKSLFLCLLLCYSPIHAVKFEKLQPLVKICSVVPWQQLFNVSLIGALGWLGYENFQLKKSSKDYLLKKDADNFQPLAAMISYVTQEDAKKIPGLNRDLYVLKTDAADTYLPKTETKNFVQKTQEENNALAQRVVALALPILDKQYVNINRFNQFAAKVDSYELQLGAANKRIDDCATQEQLVGIGQQLDDFALKEDLAKLQTEHNDLQKQVVTANTNILQLIQQHKDFLTQLTEVKSNTTLILEQLKSLPIALASNKTFIAALAPNVGGHLAAEKFSQPVPPQPTENTKGSDETNTNG